MPSKEKLRKHSLCELWSLQRGRRAGGRLVRDVLVQDGAGRGIRGQSGWGSCCAAAEEAGSPGEQHGAADFLTLPEAIRAAGPHLEFKWGGESWGGESSGLSFCRGEEVARPSYSELLPGSGRAILIPPPQKPGAPIQRSNSLSVSAFDSTPKGLVQLGSG